MVSLLTTLASTTIDAICMGLLCLRTVGLQAVVHFSIPPSLRPIQSGLETLYDMFCSRQIHTVSSLTFAANYQ
jgi:hypothetical protein